MAKSRENARCHGEPSAPELASVQIVDDSGDLSRSEVIVKGALAVGAVSGLGTVGPFVRRALAASEDGDVGVLNFALTLERLWAAFYDEAFETVAGGGTLRGLIGLLADEENRHVRVLTRMIGDAGGEPPPTPKFDFGISRDPAAFLKLAQTFEDAGVGAYNGAATAVESREVLEMMGALAQIEARHAAAVRIQNSEAPAPDAFEPALDEGQALETVEPFIAE